MEEALAPAAADRTAGPEWGGSSWGGRFERVPCASRQPGVSVGASSLCDFRSCEIRGGGGGMVTVEAEPLA